MTEGQFAFCLVAAYLIAGSLACAYAINRGWMQENKAHNDFVEPVYGPPSDSLICFVVLGWPIIAIMWMTEKAANGVRCLSGWMR